MTTLRTGPVRPRRLVVRGLAMAACVAVAPALVGCGFRPVYARTEGGPAAAAELGAISVGLIPNRPGQMLRLALQQRFEGTGTGQAKRYDLTVQFAISGEPIGYQQDSSITRVRLVGNATYVLTEQGPARRTLTSGTARSLDGLNVFRNQLFAADLETETVQQRIADAIADQITLQLAAFFDQKAVAGG